MVYFSVLNCFPPSLHVVLSVVFIGLLSPHKMAEIRLSAWQSGDPDPRISCREMLPPCLNVLVTYNA